MPTAAGRSRRTSSGSAAGRRWRWASPRCWRWCRVYPLGRNDRGGMFAGVSRAAATRFSFYPAIPTMLIATSYDLLKSLDTISSGDWILLAAGTITAAITA